MLHGPDVSPDGPTPERGSYDQVLLAVRLRAPLERLNPHLPAETLEEVLRKVQQTETPIDPVIAEIAEARDQLLAGTPHRTLRRS